MPPCLTCPNPTRPSPGALYCPDCHAARLAATARLRADRALLAMQRNDDKAWREAGLPPRPWPLADTDWTTGQPNVTCPVCGERYHYGAPGPFTHLCPLCDTWLCWKETGEIVTKTRVERACSACGGTVTLRSGPYGDFYSCDRYPACKGKGVSRTVEYEAPRLALARWTPYQWTEMDERAEVAAVRSERAENFERWLDAIRWRRRNHARSKD